MTAITYAYAETPLFSGIGTQITENVSASEAFRLAGLDFQAVRRPVYYQGASGQPEVSPEHVCIVRSDTNALLGIHGRGYEPVQNDAIINLLDYLREDVKIENVLSTKGGRRIYATASFDCESEVLPGDTVRRYLHAFNSHDGSSSFGVFFSDIRLKCANQLAYLTGRGVSKAVEAGQGLRCKHTASAAGFAARLPQMIDLQRRSFSQSIEELKELTKLTLTPELARRMLEATFADRLSTSIKEKDGSIRPRTLQDLPEIGMIRSHYSGNTGIGFDVPGVKGTAYGMFQAITQFETHDAGRSKDSTERARARLESLWGGASSKRIDRAREAALALV